jgi:hypothetical protein
MPKIKDRIFNTFNDGTLDICEVEGRNIIKTTFADIRFGNRTVGISRFWNAKINSSTVDKTVAIPFDIKLTTLDMILIDGKQYKVLQVQEKFDAKPPENLVSLEENKVTFVDKRQK